MKAANCSREEYFDVEKKIKALPSGNILRNKVGENNCFLNGVLQCLFNLSFFPNLTSKNCKQCPEGKQLKKCVYCRIRSLSRRYFTLSNANNKNTLSVQKLRETLSRCCREKNILQGNDMEDAVEVYEILLQKIHESIKPYQSK